MCVMTIGYDMTAFRALMRADAKLWRAPLFGETWRQPWLFKSGKKNLAFEQSVTFYRSRHVTTFSIRSRCIFEDYSLDAYRLKPENQV